MIKSHESTPQDPLLTNRQLEVNYQRAGLHLALVFILLFVYMFVGGTIVENQAGYQLVFVFGFMAFLVSMLIFASRQKSAFIALKLNQGVGLADAQREYAEKYQG